MFFTNAKYFDILEEKSLTSSWFTNGVFETGSTRNVEYGKHYALVRCYIHRNIYFLIIC